ncbi:signal peptidase I [Nocardioides daedukensis]|uniref:Signal peptidase I n=1 Tax=Nocardioides daedukensis TaxID=634462 RepID=A0A7Y9RZJ2_9ACTN|nr:signal peptidase I [Nocardioides daedukensis]NYG57383.1 signal peptidase I [Nocardioides daedukensis]
MTRRVLDLFLWVGAGLGVLSLLAAAAVAILGIVPLVFTSGSMAPEMPTGSLGIARSVSADELKIGDVVSVDRSDGARVTHRIVAIHPVQDDKVALTLKGDANESVDKERYTVDSADRVLFAIPWAGHVLSALASPVTVFLGGMLVAGVLVYVVLGRRSGTSRGRRRASTGTASLVAATAVASILVQPSLAAFSDQATVTTSGFVTHRVAQPTGVQCSSNLLQITLTTPASDPRYTYWAQAYNSSNTAISIEKHLIGTGTSRSVTFNGGSADFPGVALLLNVQYQFRIHSRLRDTTWRSDTYQVQPFSMTKIVTVDAFNCGAANPPPTIGFTMPINGMTGTTAGSPSMQDQVNSICENGAYGGGYSAACGTVADGGSITDVKYILQRAGGTLGTRCWNGGSLWVTNCSFRTADTTTDKKRWSVPRLTAITYPYLSDGVFTLTIRATDNSGNVTESSIKYTVTY